MLPKYSALGKKKHHRHTIICIINQDSLDLTRPLVGLTASFLSGKPNQASAASACRSQVAGKADAGVVPEGRGAWLSGMALKKALPLHKLPRCCKRWSIITKKNQHWVPLLLPTVAFPLGSRVGLPRVSESAGSSVDAVRLGWFWLSIWYRLSFQCQTGGTHFPFHMQKQESCNKLTCLRYFSGWNYIYIYKIKIPSSLGKWHALPLDLDTRTEDLNSRLSPPHPLQKDQTRINLGASNSCK